MTTAWFVWRGKRFEAALVGDKWILACPLCGDGIVFSHNESPHDEMWLPHTIEVGPDGALTVKPSVVCPRTRADNEHCSWHVTITAGAAS